MDIKPCHLGPITPAPMVRGHSRVRADCGCGYFFNTWDEARLRDHYAAHLTIPAPPAEVLAQDAPTIADVKLWPEFFISGPGRAVAEKTHCPHKSHYLTDSCPGCDYDADQLVLIANLGVT